MPWRPRNQTGVTPQHKGRFDGFDVLANASDWDDVTAGVVLSRLAPVSELAFFTDTERTIVGALCDRLLAQDAEPRVPIVALIDQRLAVGETDGWHYSDLPPDPEAWRSSLAALDEDAEKKFQTGFATIDRRRQAGLIQAVQDLANDSADWHGWPASQIWSLWTRYACTAFYSHPWAWNEIGFSGPAYPRGYKNLGINARERFETTDTAGTDPVLFASRVEHAHHHHSELAKGADE